MIECHLPVARVLSLHLTSGCQSRCVGCSFRGAGLPGRLNAATCGRLVEEAVGLGCRKVILTGGEPLLRSDIEEVLAATENRGPALVLMTNGIALAKHSGAVARSCTRVLISFDGHDRVSYRKQRGVDAFEAVSLGIKKLRGLRPDIPIVARVTVTKANAGQLERVAQSAIRVGVSGVSFIPADTASSTAFGRNAPMALPLPDLGALRDELAALANAPSLAGKVLGDNLERVWDKYAADAGLKAARSPDCRAPLEAVVVEPDLRIRPCFFLPHAGSVRDGLRAGLVQARVSLARFDVQSDPTCARCVCGVRSE